jgi:TolB-like protein/Tfp pilus assembly protein PilF
MAGQSFLTELKRRNVIRMAGLYLVGAWLLVQVAGTVLPMFGAPAWMPRSIVVLLALGFVPVLVFSWVFELTPEGIKRDAEVPPEASIGSQTARRMEHMTVAILMLAVVYFCVDKFVMGPRREAAIVQRASAAPPRPVAAVAPSVDPKSIAVLPFVDMSQDKDQEYFSDGLSEELLNLLAQLPQLRVIARTSSFSFKGREVDVATIARTLNVAHVLEGSVRKSGNTLRITAQLIRASDSTHLWSQTYDRELTDVFKVQDEIATAVVAALKVQLLSGQAMSNTHRNAKPEAYNLFLLGDRLRKRGNEQNWRQGIITFRKVIALDPNYAAAYAGLAWSEGGLADRLGDKKLLAQAVADASKAIALAPDLTDGYLARGTYRLSFRDWAGAKSDFDKALSLNPGESAVQQGYGRLMVALGRAPEALAASKRAAELDPLSAGPWTQMGRVHNSLGQLPAARDVLERSVVVNPDSDIGYFHLGINHLLAGDAASALAIFSKRDNPYSLAGVAMAEHALGHARESQQALDRLSGESAAGGAYQIAEVHAWRGDRDRAFAWLDRAAAQNDGGLNFLKLDPLISPLRTDPRYAALLAKLGLPP